MNPVYVDICSYLASPGGFGTVGTDIFGGEWGEYVDKQILVLDQPGSISIDIQEYEQPDFQILIRGECNESNKLVNDRARLIYEFLNAASSDITINSTMYLGFDPKHPPHGLGRDDNERFIATLNYQTYRNGA